MPLNATSTQEEKCAHYRDMLQRYVAGVSKDDVDAVCALFADDAVIEDPFGTEPMVGAAAVRAFYDSVAARKVRLRILGPVTGSHSNAAGMQMEVSLLGTALRCTSIAYFTEQGLISRYMAHWGPGDYDEAKGDPSQLQPE